MAGSGQPAPLTAAGLLGIAPVLPVVVVADAASAVRAARALLRGGIAVMEITLRTPSAVDALSRVAAEVPEMTVGAGTVTALDQVDRAVAAGARFLVSPGTTVGLCRHAVGSGLPYLPGVATVSEMMAAVEAGLTELKFFPAEAGGGPEYLAAVAPVLPQARFCPTGGITAQNAARWLRLPSVACVGGSWLTPRDALASGDVDRVERLAREAISTLADARS